MKSFLPLWALALATFTLSCAESTSAPDGTAAAPPPTSSYAEEYAAVNLQAFLAAPSSTALHRASCGLFNSTLAQPPVAVETILHRVCPDAAVYERVQLLVNHTLWFTDYANASPSFSWQDATISSRPELLHEQRWEFTSAGQTEIVTWDEVIAYVMGVPTGTIASSNPAAYRRLRPLVGPTA